MTNVTCPACQRGKLGQIGRGKVSPRFRCAQCKAVFRFQRITWDTVDAMSYGIDAPPAAQCETRPDCGKGAT